MGYRQELFGEVDETFICQICSMVLQDPVQVDKCDHLYCKVCIEKWMVQKMECPSDRIEINSSNLKQLSRPLRDLYLKLRIRCKFYREDECEFFVSIEEFGHQTQCLHRDRPMTQCVECSMMVLTDQIRNHNCIIALRERVANMENVVSAANTRCRTPDAKTMTDLIAETIKVFYY